MELNANISSTQPLHHKMDKVLLWTTSLCSSGIQRALHNKFDVQLANSAEEGLSLIKKAGSFAVVVSDFQMPGCDGATFLAQVGVISPDSIRMMLTGNAQLEPALELLTKGNIFRFLSKPCPMDVLEKALLDGLRQFHLIRTERDYYALKKWNEGLGGLIQAFARLIESKDPYTAGHQLRVSQFSTMIANSLGFAVEATNQIRMAAMVHDIGKIYIPIEFLNKPGSLNPSEWNIVKMHSQVGHDILEPIGFPFPIHKSFFNITRESTAPAILWIEGIGNMYRGENYCSRGRHRSDSPSSALWLAKGFGEAIRKLENNRGVKYDRKVSEAALALLAAKQFNFE